MAVRRGGGGVRQLIYIYYIRNMILLNIHN